MNAILCLRTKLDGWTPVAKLLHVKEQSLINMRSGHRNVSVTLAFRVARVLGVGFDALIAETWMEPGMCPRCGYRKASVGDDHGG